MSRSLSRIFFDEHFQSLRSYTCVIVLHYVGTACTRWWNVFAQFVHGCLFSDVLKWKFVIYWCADFERRFIHKSRTFTFVLTISTEFLQKLQRSHSEANSFHRNCKFLSNQNIKIDKELFILLTFQKYCNWIGNDNVESQLDFDVPHILQLELNLDWNKLAVHESRIEVKIKNCLWERSKLAEFFLKLFQLGRIQVLELKKEIDN